MNIPTRVGFQTPFTNVTLDLTPPSTIAGDYVVIGGELMDMTYGEFQKEMDMFNAAFAECLYEGDAKNRIFTFPIPTYNISKDFDWNNPKIEKIWEMTARYGIPYFANFINSDMNPEDARSMCCRLRLDNRELRKRGGGLFGANPLTGSIGVVTINLPRLGYLAKDESDFFNRLDELMVLAKNSLEIKRKALENFTANDLYPYTKFYLSGIYQRDKKYWGNHFSTIGLVGMNEACVNFLNTDISSVEGKTFALKVLDFMRERIMRFQEETGNFYNLEATPAEGVTYRFARADKEKYPDIKTAGKGEPYYTNSVHLPVSYTDNLFEILDHQDDLQTKFTGGTVVHLFLGEKIDDIEVVKALVKKIAENYSLPYFTLTPTFSVCPVHGYLPGEHKYCPYDHSSEELLKYGIEAE
ncbi:MAG: Anaerobic ribonucleoside-triphosphate reductase [Spirochaetes bacterium ADurb.Bin218]|nr:MAG: Anaerobic ribonucleoside-triphosphate reductase [Spirochaetes bacterium ADurb.Bin218]